MKRRRFRMRNGHRETLGPFMRSKLGPMVSGSRPKSAVDPLRGVWRTCLLLGLAFLMLTGTFVGSMSSDASAQESFALTQGTVYWNSTPMFPKESHDIWWIFLDARIDITGSTVQGGGAVPYDYHYGESNHVGSGQWSVTGTFDPTTGSLAGRLLYSSSYTYQDNVARWRISYEVDADFSGLAAGPGKNVRLALSNGMSTFKMEKWLAGSGQWSTVEDIPRSPNSQVWGLEFSQQGGPAAFQGSPTVMYAGRTSSLGTPTAGGILSWVPLIEGDVLSPGSVILVGGEGDPQTGGGRVVIALSPTFHYVVEPHSRVTVMEGGGLRVESGSVEIDDEAPIENYNIHNDNGFCGGKDPGAAQPPLEAQALTGARLFAAAAGDCRYRFEVLSDGSTKVSAMKGAVKVKSTKTQAEVILSAGQYVTMTTAGLGNVLEKSFTDVNAGNPYRTAIIGMALREIVNGYKKGDLWEFRPTDPVKRAQFAKMIVGAMSLLPKPTTATRFTDLGTPDTAGYPHVFVQAAYESKITTGTNTAQTLFAPWDAIKRAQVVTMIVRAAKELWPGVLETPPAAWSGQMSSFTDANHGANMRVAEYNGLLDGLAGFGQDWNPYGQATRGEVAQMLWNLMTR